MNTAKSIDDPSLMLFFYFPRSCIREDIFTIILFLLFPRRLYSGKYFYSIFLSGNPESIFVIFVCIIFNYNRLSREK